MPLTLLNLTPENFVSGYCNTEVAFVSQFLTSLHRITSLDSCGAFSDFGTEQRFDQTHQRTSEAKALFHLIYIGWRGKRIMVNTLSQ